MSWTYCAPPGEPPLPVLAARPCSFVLLCVLAPRLRQGLRAERAQPALPGPLRAAARTGCAAGERGLSPGRRGLSRHLPSHPGHPDALPSNRVAARERPGEERGGGAAVHTRGRRTGWPGDLGQVLCPLPRFPFPCHTGGTHAARVTWETCGVLSRCLGHSKRREVGSSVVISCFHLTLCNLGAVALPLPPSH